MRFLVVTSAPTFFKKDQYSAYAPYVKEMNIWFANVEEVSIISPDEYSEHVFTEEFDLQKLNFFKLPPLYTKSLPHLIYSIVRIPEIIIKIWRAYVWADHIHLRCPGNISLIGCILQIFFPKKPKTAKYAGNWEPGAEQPWTYRFQKWLLSNTFLTKNMKVLVYGEWPNQTKNIIPFFTTSFSKKVISEVKEKSFTEPFIFLFVGNLVEGKQPLIAIKIVQQLQKKLGKKLIFGLDIYGNGPKKKELEEYCIKNGLDELVKFKGNQPLEILKEAYQKAHFLILPSRSEGWPKVVAEAMFFGCIPIATAVSCVPWMLGNGSRGFVLNNSEFRIQNSEMLRLEKLLVQPEILKQMSEEAKLWSQQYTLERFEAAIQEVLERSNEKSFSPSGRGGGVG